MNTLGERLRHARKLRGLTQQQLASRSKVKQGTISQIERGDQQQTSYGISLAIALDILPEWLATGDGPMEYTGQENRVAETGPDYSSRRPIVKIMHQQLNEMNDEEISKLMAFAAGLKAARSQNDNSH